MLREAVSRMIIGATFFGDKRDWNSLYYDTPIPTAELDELTIYQGMYDELFITVDTETNDSPEKPTQWQIKTIMDAEFNNSIEAGSIDGKGHTITDIQIYRREYQAKNAGWDLVAQFPYVQEYNIYTVIDRFIENDKVYEYAVVPLSYQLMGDMTLSIPVESKFNETFITDLDNNYPMRYNLRMTDVTYNKNVSTALPLNAQFPIVTFGKQNYRTGGLSFRPITPRLEEGLDKTINAQSELKMRKQIINWLNDGKAKVLRREDGDMIVIAVDTITTTPISDSIEQIQDVGFNFTEIGKLDYTTKEHSGLIARAQMSVFSYDDYGNVVWSDERINEDARRIRENYQ